MMVVFIVAVLTYLRAYFVALHNLVLEAAALREQLVVFKRKQTRRRLYRVDRLSWVALGIGDPRERMP